MTVTQQKYQHDMQKVALGFGEPWKTSRSWTEPKPILVNNTGLAYSFLISGTG